ncbi:nuclear transport factor 2 family protein [Spirosoma areae]
MKRILFLGLFLYAPLLWAQTPRAATAVSPSAAASVSITAASADEKAVIDTEKQRFVAQVNNDYAVLEKVLSNDLIYTHSHGGTDTKQSYIQAIREGRTKYEAIDPEEQKVRVYGNTAVINGLCRTKVTSNGQTNTMRLRYTDVYVRTGNQWQMVAWQSLKLAN